MYCKDDGHDSAVILEFHSRLNYANNKLEPSMTFPREMTMQKMEKQQTGQNIWSNSVKSLYNNL